MWMVGGVFFFLTSANLFAQDITNNTYPTGSEDLYSEYTKAIGKSGRLYNGSEYSFDDFQYGEHPFLGRKIFLPNRLVYDGFTYESVEIMYDVYRDQLVLAHSDENGNFARIALYSEKVVGFTLGERQFVRLQETENIPESGIGFYELLYNEHLVVLAKRKKKLRPAGENYSYEFYGSDQFYLQKDGIYYSLKSKKDIYRVFVEDKKSLKAYARQTGINRVDLENFIVSLTEYYVENIIQE